MIRVDYRTNPSTLQTVNVRPVQRTANNTKDDINRDKDIYLIYFRSDMTGRVCYAYAFKERLKDFGNKRSTYQWTEITIDQVSPQSLQDVYKGKVNLNPAGYWYYIIYEVNFANGTEIQHLGGYYDLISTGFAPIDNIGTYGEIPVDAPPLDNRGILGIAVEEGKMFVNQIPPEGGRYTEYSQTNDNYIYTK